MLRYNRLTTLLSSTLASSVASRRAAAELSSVEAERKGAEERSRAGEAQLERMAGGMGGIVIGL